MNIVAFGCSNTYGQALGNEGKNDPSPLAWPGRLAELYNCTVENLGQCGASNKSILHRILDYNYKPDDVVFVCWTNLDRWSVIQKDGIVDIGIWHVDDKFKYNNKGDINLQHKFSKIFFEVMHDYNDMILDYYRNCMLAHYFLNDKTIKNFHTATAEYDKLSTVWFDHKKYLMPDSHFYKSWNKYPLADDDCHPGPLAHAELAEKLYNYSKDQF